MGLGIPRGENRMNTNPLQDACEEEWLTQEKPSISEKRTKACKTNMSTYKHTHIYTIQEAGHSQYSQY